MSTAYTFDGNCGTFHHGSQVAVVTARCCHITSWALIVSCCNVRLTLTTIVLARPWHKAAVVADVYLDHVLGSVVTCTKQSSETLCKPLCYCQMAILAYHPAARQLLLPLVWAAVVLLVQTASGTVGPPCWWGLLCTCERGYHITIHTYTCQHCASTKNSMCSINNNKKRLLKYLWQSRNVVIHRLSSRMF